jgi:hypothetical protein
LTIIEGEAYNATLTATEGYVLDSVVITMGGEDVTSTVYADGIISIDNVTGDIVITARAKKSGPTNIIDTVGYTDGYRLSNSSGNLSVLAGYTTTGLITVPDGRSSPVTIRTKGVNFNYANGTCNLVLYNADGTRLASTTLYGGSPASAFNGFSWSFDDEGNMTMTYIQAGTNIKICGYGSGANLIVTINEEIV